MGYKPTTVIPVIICIYIYKTHMYIYIYYGVYECYIIFTGFDSGQICRNEGHPAHVPFNSRRLVAVTPSNNIT
jgi:hypothetical protein